LVAATIECCPYTIDLMVIGNGDMLYMMRERERERERDDD